MTDADDWLAVCISCTYFENLDFKIQDGQWCILQSLIQAPPEYQELMIPAVWVHSIQPSVNKLDPNWDAVETIDPFVGNNSTCVGSHM